MKFPGEIHEIPNEIPRESNEIANEISRGKQ
jgi:hypothetical protein